MPRYFVDGRETSRGHAICTWRDSATYRNARFPDAIFNKGEHGVDDGGVTVHLAEAGIRIDASKAQEESNGN